MENDNDLMRFMAQDNYLSGANRPLRLRLAPAHAIADDILLPQQIHGGETICGGLDYRILCVAADPCLALKEFIAVPAAIDIVTDQGELHSICGIVTEARAGDSDGGLATYQLRMTDALTILEKRVNTRVFRHKSEIDIVLLILDEWRLGNPVLAGAFEREVDELFHQRAYPAREFTMQHNESDAAFIRRLLRRRGIAWHFRAGRGRNSQTDPQHDSVPAHTMVMFNNTDSQRQSAAGVIRYHRDHATEQRDSITSWTAVRSLQAGSVQRHSWDYANPAGRQFMAATARGAADQGSGGNAMAASLDDYLVQMPHAGDDHEDLARLGQLSMSRHDMATKCFQAEASVRNLRLREYFTLQDHPEIDGHPAAERDFTVTALQLAIHNNLPRALAAKVARLFARNRWLQDGPAASGGAPGAQLEEGPVRVHVQFTAVRRDTSIVPSFDEACDLPQPRLQSAIVVGPAGEQVHCDRLGRVKIRFPATRPDDHRHADGVGASDSDADSAWVRVASGWAGAGPGSLHQCGSLGLPRVGSEVLVDFLGGDPDKPVVVGQVYNQQAQPPALSARGELPGNRYLSGIRSGEIGGQRGNQLRFDDTHAQISAQLASDHGTSQLNLGKLTEPRADGHGAPRGEGAELRSDMAVALRGADGVLISADARADAQGTLLDRNELIAIADSLQKLARQLGQLAVTHAADQPDGPQLAQLVDRLKNLHSEAAPMVAVSAPAGLVLASGQNAALGASGNIDLASSGATRLMAGEEMALRAAAGISLFAHRGAVKLSAAGGKVQIQAQNDVLELLAQKVLDIISTTDWINISAKQGVRINGGGTELVLSADGIKGLTSGKHEMHAADHQTLGPQSAAKQFPGFSACAANGKANAGNADTPLN